MTRKLEIWVESAGAWRDLRLNAAGEPVYVSNGAQVGAGMRITRVSDAPPPPPSPDPAPDPFPYALPSELEFSVMASGTIDAVVNRLIPYPFPQAGVFPRMYDMTVGGTVYTFSTGDQGAQVFTSGIYTVSIGFWGFVQVLYDAADAAQLPANGASTTILTITQFRIVDSVTGVVSAQKGPLVLKITGNTLTIDTTPPTVVSVSPSGTGVTAGTPVTITASEDVQAGAGNFTIHDVVAGTVLETIAAAAAEYVGNQITVTPTLPQADANQYALRWAAGTFTDASPQANPVAAETGNTWVWTTSSAPVSTGIWYDDVFVHHDGTGVGPRVASTPVATWASGQSGVSVSGTQVTITGGGKTITGVDFGGLKVVNSGANNIFEDCIGVVSTNGQGGNGRQWSIGGSNPIVRYCRITNPNRLGGVVMLAFHDASGTATEHNNDLRDWAGQDPLKGPNAGVVLVSRDSLFKGCHLTSGAHIDTIDFRLSEPGSSVRGALIIGDKTATSVTPGGGTGFNNAIRQGPSDFGGAGGAGLIVEENILVGHDDPAAQSYFISVGNAGKAGNVFYDVLVDLRYHPNLLHPSARFDDWYVRYFDYAASVAAGKVVGIGAPVPYPYLAAQPAQVPATMAAPVISAAPGAIAWAANARPLNMRSLITRYDLRWSTDGTNWTTVQDVSRTAGNIPVTAASNYRIQFRAVNGIGAGAWSASSNQINVAAPAGTHRIMVLYGQSEIEHILNADAAGAPSKPALTADNRVKFVYHNPRVGDPRPVVSKWIVASDASLSGPMIAFANMLIAIGGPLDTWEVGWITYTGMGWSTYFNDGSPKFPFSTGAAIKAAMSGLPTLQYQSWLSSNRNLDTAYARAFENLWLGKDNGAAISAPWNVKDKSGATAFSVAHLMPEQFNPAVTIPVLGQHKFDVRQDNDSYDTPTGGGAHTDYTSANIHGCRQAVDTFFAGASVGPSLRGIELCSYLNGYASGGGWTDIPHPSRKNADGGQRFAGHLAYAMCEALGLVTTQPEITSVTWADTKVTISAAAGAITNVFAARSESQLNPATFPHYTQAMGFYINGQPAQRAEIVGGNIELYYGDGTQKFINTDTIMFLPGGAGASLKYPEDMQNAVWKGVPCVNIGVPGDGLMNLRPMINFNALFPNTLSNTVR